MTIRSLDSNLDLYHLGGGIVLKMDGRLVWSADHSNTLRALEDVARGFGLAFAVAINNYFCR